MANNYCDGYYYNGNCNSNWYNWGRWVLAAGVAVFFIFVFLTLACLRNRRRRRLGLAPMYGTGWIGGRPGYGPNPNQPYYNPNAPPYQAPMGFQQTGNTYNSNEGYYGRDVELQQPPNVYARAGDPVYDAPAGPPPGKGDGVIR
ncbi:hypothetical protein OIDMADRAFT_17553 [Oidiodendron maius Zn]|uniref:Uncharacterized protein n=1 Tax=Oidiodendron maius (strain Zn) TaxID=913774 RepID=A0A0C3HNB6_OIDMZ|nr:hypothetical protein OIDMADRAFT_17553 [Oidiodendron maius Zn]